MKTVRYAFAFLSAAMAQPLCAQAFDFKPAGVLWPNSGRGVTDGVVYAPAIKFPIDASSYANSQVWMKGGSKGPPGNWSWKHPDNFKYPWWDNFCEARSRRTPNCPAGAGHQGQDIRAGLGENDKHWAIATEDGRISNVGVYSVELTGRTTGTRYRYLHLSMDKLRVRQGQEVRAGDKIGLVSNDFGGTPTPIHLHFEMLQNINGTGLKHVPPYMSLVRAYQRRLASP